MAKAIRTWLLERWAGAELGPGERAVPAAPAAGEQPGLPSIARHTRGLSGSVRSFDEASDFCGYCNRKLSIFCVEATLGMETEQGLLRHAMSISDWE